MLKKTINVSVIAATIAVLLGFIIYLLVMFFGTPWGKKTAEEEFSAALYSHFGDKVVIDEVVYSFKADRYECYATIPKTQTHIWVIRSEDDYYYTNTETGNRHILEPQSAFESRKQMFSENEAFVERLLNFAEEYDDIRMISADAEDNAYHCTMIGSYYCYSESQEVYDEETSEAVLALMQRTLFEKIEFADEYIRFYYDCEGAAYQESIVYCDSADSLNDIENVVLCGELSDNLYYISQKT